MTEEKTLRKIAEELGISHQAVSEIIERAMRKIKIELMKRGINLDDLIDN
jgi:predicted DNA binding protein